MKRNKACICLLLAILSILLTASYSTVGTVWPNRFYSWPTQMQGSYSYGYTMVIQLFLDVYNDTTHYWIDRGGGADGYFGSCTKEAVITFQQWCPYSGYNGLILDDDGIVGGNTWYAMCKELVIDETVYITGKYDYKFLYNGTKLILCSTLDQSLYDFYFYVGNSASSNNFRSSYY